MADFPAERRILRQQIEKRLDTIKATLYRNIHTIENLETSAPMTGRDVEPPPVDGWAPCAEGVRWGGPDTTQWFRATITIPEDLDGQRVVALLNLGGESLCYVDGAANQGLDMNRDQVVLRREAKAGEQVSILIDANTKNEDRFVTAKIAAQDMLAWDLYHDLRVAYDVALTHDDTSDAHQGLLALVHSTISMIDLNATADVETYHDDLTQAGAHFQRGVKKYQHSYNSGKYCVVGQSHLDTAWLWPLRTTRKKCGRTWATALRYMDDYPDYTFAMGQPQLYEYVKEHYPELYVRLKEKIKSGQWEVAGAPWVEQDLNLPSGEAHVRQYLYGNRFFREEFGIHTRIVWMPDCFGYTFSLPQIMKKAQIDYFYTTKLHGNEFNRHPYNLFRWRGIDGSEVLAMQTPYGCNDRPTPERLKTSWNAFQQKSVAEYLPFTFGHGDGGGGPTLEYIEYANRLGNMTGIPRVEWGKAEETYARLAAEVDWDQLPIFHDEMFYEKHHGVQTSQANTKKNNRKGELLARDTEFFSTLAFLAGTSYEHKRINDAWKLILLNQFHDILPGSSIAEVYEEADQDYATAFAALNEVKQAALDALSAESSSTVTVRNTLGWDRDDVASISATDIPTGEVHAVDESGHVVPSQRVTAIDGTESLLFEAKGVPSLGSAAFTIEAGEASVKRDGRKAPKASSRKLENDFYTVKFASNGTISELYDKVNERQVLADGAKGNVLQLFEDRPANNDAWDINFNFTDQVEEITDIDSMEVVENGPVRATIRIVRSTTKSRIEQDISLWRSLPRIDFTTRVDWHEKHKLLKAAFPVDVRSRRATFEIQYGAIERPTHRSTLWDRARYEVPAHRWIDLSESDYGVSLLNDCKYGFDVLDNVMRISLLRSPTLPDPNCDEGEHEFVYSLMPHADSWQKAESVRRGYELNVPLVCAAGTASGTLSSFAHVDRDNVVIDCVKKAEDTDDVIVRLYEAHGSRGAVTLRFGTAPKSVSECDLMEENDTPVEIDGPDVAFTIAPWEIRTFKVRF